MFVGINLHRQTFFSYPKTPPNSISPLIGEIPFNRGLKT
jgi:hypothetical protein